MSKPMGSANNTNRSMKQARSNHGPTTRPVVPSRTGKAGSLSGSSKTKSVPKSTGKMTQISC